MHYFNRQFSLECFRNLIGENILAGLKKSRPKTRNGSSIGLLGFIWLSLAIAVYSAQRNLKEIFSKALGDDEKDSENLPEDAVTPPAYSQYRSRTPVKMAMRLWRSLVERAGGVAQEGQALWRNLKLFAVDLSTLNLPEAFWPHFDCAKGPRGDGPAQSRIALLYDLFMRIPVAFRMGRADADERGLVKKLFCHLKAGSLLLMDTGLYSIEMFAMLARRSVHFITPMRSNGKPRLIKRLGGGEGIYEIHKSYPFKNRPDVPERMQVRIVTIHRKGFRARRLVTSLMDSEAYPAAEVAHIYHERWHIETFFREYKHVLKAQHFHTRKKRALYIEVIFQMILCTLTRTAMAEAALEGRRRPGEISFTKSLSEMRKVLEKTTILPLEKWAALYRHLLEKIKTLKIDKRPGRSFERDRQKRRQKSRRRALAQLKRKQGNAA